MSYLNRQGRAYDTPYAVICPDHGIACLTLEQYSRQLNVIGRGWECPTCGRTATWDDHCPETNPPTKRA